MAAVAVAVAAMPLALELAVLALIVAVALAVALAVAAVALVAFRRPRRPPNFSEAASRRGTYPLVCPLVSPKRPSWAISSRFGEAAEPAWMKSGPG